jgi:hypothetical protein
MSLGVVTGTVVDGAVADIGVEAVAAGRVVLAAASLPASALADKAASGLCADPPEPPPQEAISIAARPAHDRARKEHRPNDTLNMKILFQIIEIGLLQALI